MIESNCRVNQSMKERFFFSFLLSPHLLKKFMALEVKTLIKEKNTPFYLAFDSIFESFPSGIQAGDEFPIYSNLNTNIREIILKSPFNLNIILRIYLKNTQRV